jgi:hypothetical protein
MLDLEKTARVTLLTTYADDFSLLCSLSLLHSFCCGTIFRLTPFRIIAGNDCYCSWKMLKFCAFDGDAESCCMGARKRERNGVGLAWDYMQVRCFVSLLQTGAFLL